MTKIEQQIQRTHALMMTVCALLAERPRPSGEVYAMLMPSGVDIHGYEQAIRILVASELLTESPSHMLTATPKGATFGREYLAALARGET